MRLFIAKINEHDTDVGILNDVCMNTNKTPTTHEIAALQKTVVANPTGDQPGPVAARHGPRACNISQRGDCANESQATILFLNDTCLRNNATCTYIPTSITEAVQTETMRVSIRYFPVTTARIPPSRAVVYQ